MATPTDSTVPDVPRPARQATHNARVTPPHDHDDEPAWEIPDWLQDELDAFVLDLAKAAGLRPTHVMDGPDGAGPMDAS